MPEQDPLIERLSLLRARGGLPAGARWLLRRATGVDAYTICARDLGLHTQTSRIHVPATWTFEVLTAGTIGIVDASLVTETDAHNGCTVAETISRGGRVYALHRNGRLLCQAKIEFATAQIDTPLPMVLDVGTRNAFLSYLYTQPDARRIGAARSLITLIGDDLAAAGACALCVCHVQATNIRSLNTFRAAGWVPAASMWTIRGRMLRIVRTSQGRQMDIEVRWRRPARSPFLQTGR